MVVRERHYNVDEEVPTPGNVEFLEFCEELGRENADYDKIPVEKLEKFGIHTSIMLHDYPDGEGRWASIHYREGLEKLVDIEGYMKKSKVFLGNLNEDLHLLAERLQRDLEDVRMIYGLTHLSSSWGNRHGFETKGFTKDQQRLLAHRQSITGRPTQINEQAPLTLFFIDRARFIQVFHAAFRTNQLGMQSGSSVTG